MLVATGVYTDGHREVLGLKVVTSETGQAWNGFFADLVARGLSGVLLVTSDAHRGLVEAIAANLPGTAWQRCRTHYADLRITWTSSLSGHFAACTSNREWSLGERGPARSERSERGHGPQRAALIH